MARAGEPADSDGSIELQFWYSLSVMVGSTVDTCSASASGLWVFSTCWWTRLLKSILSCSPVWGRARRGPRLWYVLAGFAGYGAPRAVFFSIGCRPENGEVALTMLQLLHLPGSGNYFYEPLVFCSHLYAVRAFRRGVFGSPR